MARIKVGAEGGRTKVVAVAAEKGGFPQLEKARRMKQRRRKDSGKKAVVLVSGGLDSAVAGGLAREEGYAIYALSFDYGQRHRRELSAARRVATWLSATEHKIIKVGLDQIGGSALTDRLPVPRNRQFRGIPATYVPARNLIFLAVAVAWAEVISAERIVIGVNAIDFSGYPDCRPEFITAFQKTILVGTKAGVKGRAPTVWAPLQDLSKAEIVKQGVRLGLDFKITHSCYDPSPRGQPCGVCDSCRLRAKGFQEAEIPDPLVKNHERKKKAKGKTAPPARWGS